MDFTITFIINFGIGIRFVCPVLISLICYISLLGIMIGKLEGWSRIDTFYYSCITATTVGYGDFRPHDARSKLMAVAIAFFGLLLTGIVVAVALHSLSMAFEETDRIEKFGERHVKSAPAEKYIAMRLLQN